jgi:hypothetical protein
MKTTDRTTRTPLPPAATVAPGRGADAVAGAPVTP